MKEAIVVWFTGLSGSGKTTIAKLAVEQLRSQDFRVQIIDADAVRQSITTHLGFSPEDISQNNRVIAEICLKQRSNFDLILVPIISPFRQIRKEVRRELGEPFLEVYVKASVDTVLKRDPKGLYKLANEGKISSMVGLTSEVPYEVPQNPELVLDTESYTASELADELVNFIISRL